MRALTLSGISDMSYFGRRWFGRRLLPKQFCVMIEKRQYCGSRCFRCWAARDGARLDRAVGASFYRADGNREGKILGAQRKIKPAHSYASCRPLVTNHRCAAITKLRENSLGNGVGDTLPRFTCRRQLSSADNRTQKHSGGSLRLRQV